jgi:hypothetical protein
MPIFRLNGPGGGPNAMVLVPRTRDAPWTRCSFRFTVDHQNHGPGYIEAKTGDCVYCISEPQEVPGDPLKRQAVRVKRITWKPKGEYEIADEVEWCLTNSFKPPKPSTAAASSTETEDNNPQQGGRTS